MSHQNMLQVLSADGASAVAAIDDVPEQDLVDLYRWLAMGRAFEQRAMLLQRQGRLGVFGPIEGQEAAYVGSAAALQRHDWICPTYRDFLPCVMHGLPLETAWLYYRGDLRGQWPPQDVRVLPFQTVLATQIPHAVGLAMAARHRGEDAVAMAYFGDGASSEGDFHEGLNMAGIYRAPVVFFCINNHWAISVPRHRQSAAETLAERAAGYGFPGVRVDGMDVLAVYQATRAAVQRARAGEGPTLIEAVAYRVGAHSTVDDPSRYRSAEEVAPWRERDALQRYRTFLTSRGLWSDAQDTALFAELGEQILAAFEATFQLPPPDPRWMFDNLYAAPPPEMAAQKRAMLRAYKLDGEEDT